MPWLIGKRTWAGQPQYPLRVDWGNPITRGLVFSFDAGPGHVDLVTGKVGEPLGSGVSRSVGKYGKNYRFSGSQSNRSCSFGIHMGMMGATQETLDILVYFDASYPSAHIFGQWDSNQKWLLQSNFGNIVWVAAQDDSLNRRRFDSFNHIFTTPGWYRIILSWRGANDATMMVDRQIVTITNVNSVANVIGPSNTADYLQIGTVNGGSALAGNVAFARAFTRGMSVAEMYSLHDNPWQIYEPETIPLFFSTVTAQYARPTSDVSAGTWTASSGSDLFAMLDETVANDADYIVTTGASTCEVALGTLSDPASSSGHIVRYRISADSGGITVRLRQGTTTIATWTHASAPTSLTTYEQTLTGGEADSISDYSALRLQFEATT